VIANLPDHVRSFVLRSQTANAISAISIGIVRGVRGVRRLKLQTRRTYTLRPTRTRGALPFASPDYIKEILNHEHHEHYEQCR
jgi:hypothetical protein